jgi:hypothetical protein
MLRQPQMAALEKLHCGSRHDVNGRYGPFAAELFNRVLKKSCWQDVFPAATI